MSREELQVLLGLDGRQTEWRPIEGFAAPEADPPEVEALERALEAETGCADVLQLIASVRGAMNGLMAEVMEDHIRLHVVDPAREADPHRARGAEDLIDVVRTYLK